MSTPVSSLPEAWVERIFTVMRANYGASFDRQWECPAGVDPATFVAELKGVWGRELARYQQSPQAIEHALDHLPEHAPNLPQFRALCASRAGSHPALPAPKHEPVDPEGVKRVTKELRGLRRERPNDSRAWAYRLQERDQRGKGLTLAQRAMYRSALGINAE